MSNFSLANSLSVSVRIYRALLVMYPKKFRAHYETHMVQVFRDSYREAYYRNGMPGVIDLWLHTCFDLLVTALIERIMERSHYMFPPRVIVWSGVASIFSGLFWLMMAYPWWLQATKAPLLLALVLDLGGLAGLYSLQSGHGGKLGLAGFALGIIGTGLPLATLWWGSTSGRFSVERDATLGAPPFLIFTLAMVILGIGIVLLGITSLRGKTFQHWRVLPLGLGLLGTIQGMAFWLMFYLPLSQGLNPWDQWSLIGGYVVYHAVQMQRLLGVLLGLGWMGLGILLTAEINAQVAQPHPASAEIR